MIPLCTNRPERAAAVEREQERQPVDEMGGDDVQ